jgi:hypothetical protein
MPTPVSNANSSFYDPNAQLSSADGCSSTNATCGPTEAPPAREVTIPPVVITGDAGAQQLVKQLDASRNAPSCSLEGLNAALSCGKAGITAAGGALLATTVVGAAVAAAATFAEGISCGKDLRAYYDCKTP